MKRNILIGIWLFFVGVIFAKFILSENAYDGEMMILFYGQIALLTFPLGIIALVGGDWLLSDLPFVEGAPWLPHIITWVLAVILGYWQWFVFIPAFIKKVFRRKSKG